MEAIRDSVDAEVLAAGWVRALGFQDARETPPTGDAGIDVISSGAVAQVKFNAAPVGRPELQKFFGAALPHPGKHRLFFSWKGFASTAIEYAEYAQIALFSYELSGHYSPINGYAQHLSSVAHGLPLPPRTWSGATAVQATPSWWTLRHIVQVTLGAVFLGVVVFFITHPDFFIQVLVFACFLFGMWLWLNASQPKKRRRSASRRRRR